jgi:hypothetical protein
MLSPFVAPAHSVVVANKTLPHVIEVLNDTLNEIIKVPHNDTVNVTSVIEALEDSWNITKQIVLSDGSQRSQKTTPGEYASIALTAMLLLFVALVIFNSCFIVKLHHDIYKAKYSDVNLNEILPVNQKTLKKNIEDNVEETVRGDDLSSTTRKLLIPND